MSAGALSRCLFSLTVIARGSIDPVMAAVVEVSSNDRQGHQSHRRAKTSSASSDDTHVSPPLLRHSRSSPTLGEKRDSLHINFESIQITSPHHKKMLSSISRDDEGEVPRLNVRYRASKDFKELDNKSEI